MVREIQWEVAVSAPRGALARARGLLAADSIASCSSKPRRRHGLLRVAVADAARGRALIDANFGTDYVVRASEAAWFRCHACGANLAADALHCAACAARVGDPHGG